MSHLHFDHAGGLLDADGRRAFPRATIVAQRAEWEIALGDNPRLVASYDQPELRLVRDWGAEGWADGEREVLPGVTRRPDRRPLGGPPGDRRPGRRAGRADAGVLRRPRDAAVERQPAWVTAFDDFPLDSVLVKGELFAPGRRRGLDRRPVPRARAARSAGSSRDRDRYAFEPA